MAKYFCINRTGKYHDLASKYDVVNYILNPQKTAPGYFGGYHVDPYSPADSMIDTSEQYGKSSGVQLRHYVFSFDFGELSNPNTALQIAKDFASYVGQEFQTVFAVHLNKPNLHFHLVFNSCSYVDGHRFRGTRKEFYTMQNGFRSILRRYGIHRLEYQTKR